MSWDIPKACANAAPLLAFTTPGKMLNASLCSSSIWFVRGTGISGILLCCSWTLFKTACCFSSRVDRCLISSDWDLISLACCRCRCDRTDTCVQWAISPLLCWPTKLLFLEGLEHWLNLGVMKPFSELIPLVIPEPSQHYAPCPLRCCLKQGHWLGTNWALTAKGFIMAFCRCAQIYLVLCQILYFYFCMNRWNVSQMMTQLSAHSMTQKLMINTMNKRDLILTYTTHTLRIFGYIFNEISYSNPIYNVHDFPA